MFYLTRAAWPHLKKSHGVLVNTGSLSGLLSFKTPPSLAHTTAKAGVIAMTRHLAMEGREYGIRANSISPGLIETNQTREQRAPIRFTPFWPTDGRWEGRDYEVAVQPGD